MPLFSTLNYYLTPPLLIVMDNAISATPISATIWWLSVDGHHSSSLCIHTHLADRPASISPNSLFFDVDAGEGINLEFWTGVTGPEKLEKKNEVSLRCSGILKHMMTDDENFG
ncbi:unnamed protein product [Lactuca saligna]|uniref:Uncharacterized protein n=1 Tax=Lactuca saligna TaxID=75948 RepID=A0AA35V7D8_LACSI|nr:unnamed protein product [Lactuca saligna]